LPQAIKTDGSTPELPVPVWQVLEAQLPQDINTDGSTPELPVPMWQVLEA
jgi:hypothetical protein